MCGIVGIVRLDGTTPDPARLRAMADQLRHRGPDDSGFWTHGPVGFGHRRLSIIDLAGQPQPMSTPDGRFTVTYNGEILNYRELRAELDHPWRTDGDTEVLLALEARHGDAGVTRLIGQFAYALHDRDEGTVTLVRDRVGVLPLYTAAYADEVLFASEVKAILAVTGSPAVDTAQLDRYLAGRSVPAPATLFAGIRKVPPGHRVTITADGLREPVPYWTPPPPQAGGPAADPARAVAALESALTAAVDRALVADVPVGAYLSGGVDSSLIVALAKRARPGTPLHTFSAGFGDARTDELHHAEAVSRAIGTVHHPVVVSPADFTAQWNRLTWHRDAPMSEPADVAVARLAEVAGAQVKVVLSGEGSDELFAGYPKYRAARAVSHLDALPARARGSLTRGLQAVTPRRLRAVLRAVGAGSEQERLVEWFAPLQSDLRARLLGRVDRPLAPYAGRPLEGDLLRRMSMHDLGWWLSDNLLERGDRMTMAHSVELRPPFLDAHVVDLALRMPSEFKLRDGTTKWVVKELASSMVPREIVERPKAGFRVPLADWFRGGLQDLARDRLLSSGSFATEVFDRATVRELLDRHAGGRRDEAIAIWTLLSLEVWHDVFFGPGRFAGP